MKISTAQGLGFIALLLTGISVLFVSTPGCACGSPSDRGKRGIEAIQNAQERYFKHYGTFAPSLNLLEEKAALFLPPRYTQQFQFSVEAHSDLAIAYATPIQTELPIDLLKLGLHKLQFKSAVSFATHRDGKFSMLLCESLQPTTQPNQLSSPLDREPLTCPQGNQERYRRN